MQSTKALEELDLFLRRTGEKQVPGTPRAGIERMAAFYREVRAEDVDLESDGDMLLFQWGTYDWGEGPRFEVDLTRQLIRGPGEDDDIWQLHLTYRFAPSEPLSAIGEGNRWCARSSDPMTASLGILVAGLVSAVASALWFKLGLTSLYFVGQVLGVGTSIVFLLRRRERQQPMAGLGFALAVAAVAAPDVFLFVISQVGVD